MKQCVLEKNNFWVCCNYNKNNNWQLCGIFWYDYIRYVMFEGNVDSIAVSNAMGCT